MILGISASGRKDGITSKAVKAILEASQLDYEYVSLAGKSINGCSGLTGCAKTNKCQTQDDWIEIGELMLKADAIVFGAPNYYDTINGLGHACLERTFCFRHRDVFALQDKIGVTVCTANEDNDAVRSYIEKMMISNKMKILGNVYAHAYSQCYTCGYGRDCYAGAVVEKHGVLKKIEKQHFPDCYEAQKDTLLAAKNTGEMLAKLLK